jgi:hypothetical protein
VPEILLGDGMDDLAGPSADHRHHGPAAARSPQFELLVESLMNRTFMRRRPLR